MWPNSHALVVRLRRGGAFSGFQGAEGFSLQWHRKPSFRAGFPRSRRMKRVLRFSALWPGWRRKNLFLAFQRLSAGLGSYRFDAVGVSSDSIDLAHGVVEGQPEDLDVEVNGVASQIAFWPAPV